MTKKLNKRPGIWIGGTLEKIVTAYRGDLADPSVSGIINALTDRYDEITHEAMPTLTENEWCAICDVLNGCSTLITSTPDPAQYVWAEVLDSEPDGLNEKWNVDVKDLSECLRALSYAGKCAVWDVAARFWASPDLNKLPTRDLLIACGAKIGG